MRRWSQFPDIGTGAKLTLVSRNRTLTVFLANFTPSFQAALAKGAFGTVIADSNLRNAGKMPDSKTTDDSFKKNGLNSGKAEPETRFFVPLP